VFKTSLGAKKREGRENKTAIVSMVRGRAVPRERGGNTLAQ
jgi:hypothetical protein